MENKDFVVEQILSIEDFDNVDSNLLKIISENDEYRKIFDEYKELSALASECMPEPVKDGVTLCDAVMTRVQKGDIAPRYINTNKFRFPVATVASLIAVVAVVLVLRTGLPFNKAENAVEDSVIYESENFDGANYVNNASFDVVVTDDGKSDVEILSDLYDCEANYEEVPKTARDVQAVLENGNISEESEAQVNGSVVYKSYSLAESVLSDSADVVITGNISDEVAERLEYAKLHGVPTEQLISSEQIVVLGEQNFIEWFDSIKDRADFTEVYSYSVFLDYCNPKD